MLSAIAKLLSFLSGNASSIKDIAEVFFGNKKERDAQIAANEFNEQIEIHKEAAAGYSYASPARNWFDSLIDGINRLPRPLMAFLAIWFMVWPMMQPERYIESVKAMGQAPEWISTFVTIVVVFFFGSRTIAKDIPTQMSAKRAKAAIASGGTTSNSEESNPVIDQWRGYSK